MKQRQGFALLAVIWIITGASIAAMSLTLAARERVRTAYNRKAIIQAEWAAEECLARATAAIEWLVVDRRGAAGSFATAPSDSLPTLLARNPLVRDCPGTVRLVPVGLTIDIGVASADVLRRAILAHGTPHQVADSLVDALLDWRDADDVPRPFGCERSCYAGLRRESPRNGALADIAELALVRGFDAWDARTTGTPLGRIDRMFSTERGRVLITAAPFEVLAALPGIGVSGARDLISARRRSVTAFPELASVAGVLAPIARDSFALAFSTLSRIATVTPDAWRLDIVAPSIADGVRDTPLSVRLVARAQLTASGLRIQRRRMMP